MAGRQGAGTVALAMVGSARHRCRDRLPQAIVGHDHRPRVPVSRSPRMNLRTALDALDDLVEVLERHTDARDDLTSRIGEDGVREVMGARDVIARTVARLDSTPDKQVRDQ